eukprot:jgi/Mesvir1/12639/Mv02194-RA.2
MAAPIPIPRRDLYIDGKWTPVASGERLPVINPANEETVGSIPSASADDVDKAVLAARAAFDRDGGKRWSRASGAHRANILLAIAQLIKQRKTELANWEAQDSGKPLPETEWDMDDVAGCFEYYAGLAEKLDGAQDAPLELPMDAFKCHIRKEPVGVVALITPWNYPLLMATWKVAPALAAGCCAVLKPSELASVTCLELGAICTKAGLPPGVLNVVTGLGYSAGAALTQHKGVDKIAFTGSVATGRAVMMAAAADVRGCSLELGGKSPLVIFDDADVDKAVEWAMFGAFWTNGQICSATSRLLLQDGIAPKFLARLKEEAERVLVGDPLAAGTKMGPVVSATQYAKVMGYIEGAIEEGATLLTGGKRPETTPRGYYVCPTVFVDVKPHMRIWKEEIFGPVLAVATFRTEEEAIAVANDSDFGLAGAVISADPDRCKRVSEAFRCGIVWVNCSQPCFSQAPWGGMKRSGFGRDLGTWWVSDRHSV